MSSKNSNTIFTTGQKTAMTDYAEVLYANY